MNCKVCGKFFANNKEAEQHFHAIQSLSWEYPRVFLIMLPDGCCPGRWEAAGEFTTQIHALKKMCPGGQFQYIPFDHSEGAVTALLAIEQ